MLERRPPSPDRIGQTHALEDEITSARRLRLHVRIAEQLEERHPHRLMALADHWLAAAFAGRPTTAVEYGMNRLPEQRPPATPPLSEPQGRTRRGGSVVVEGRREELNGNDSPAKD